MLMPVYSYPCQMTAVGITENVKGDTKKFEIWYNAREEVYIIQVPTLQTRSQGHPRASPGWAVREFQ